MKTKVWILSLLVGFLLVNGCRQQPSAKQPAKEDLVLTDLKPPAADLTGKWACSWKDPKRNTSESISVELKLTENDITGKAVFMDANSTKADIVGQASGSKVRLLMTPHSTSPFDVLPETTWVGVLSNGTISGTWYLHGKAARGFAITGPWSANQQKKRTSQPEDSADNQ